MDGYAVPSWSLLVICQLSKCRFVGGVSKEKLIQAKPAQPFLVIISDNDKAAFPGNVSFRGLVTYVFGERW